MSKPKLQQEVPTARDFMRSKVLTFLPDTEIGEAVSRLLERGYAGAPVVEASGALVGVLSEHDCVRVLAEADYERWPTGTVRDHMTRDVETVPASMDLYSVASRFAGGRHRRFPVVENGRLVGLVARRDILLALVEHRRPKLRSESTYEILEKLRAG